MGAGGSVGHVHEDHLDVHIVQPDDLADSRDGQRPVRADVREDDLVFSRAVGELGSTKGQSVRGLLASAFL